MFGNSYSYLFKGIIMAILTFIVEYIVCTYITNTIFLTLLVIITLVITNHIMLEISLRYKVCFMLSIILLILWSCLLYLLKTNGDIGMLHYSWELWMITALNWLIPYIYCFIRQYLDRGPRFPDYNKFFVAMTIIFLIPFTIIFIYLNYVNPRFFLVYHPKEYSYIPFYTTATYIENILNHTIKLSSFSIYLCLYTLLFLPLGYHLRLLAKSFSLSTRFLLFVVICAGAEIIKIPILDTFNIDNIFYSFIGILLGAGLFSFVDYKHYQKKDREYLYKSSFNFTYRY